MMGMERCRPSEPTTILLPITRGVICTLTSPELLYKHRKNNHVHSATASKKHFNGKKLRLEIVAYAALAASCSEELGVV